MSGEFTASPSAPVSIYEWAVTANLQPEPITVEVWRNLSEEFCSQVELVNGQVVRCGHPSRAHQAAASRTTAMLDAAAEAHMERNPGTCLDKGDRVRGSGLSTAILVKLSGYNNIDNFPYVAVWIPWSAGIVTRMLLR